MKNVLVPMKDTQKKSTSGNFLAVQWLGLCTFTAEDLGSVPSRGTKILQAAWRGQKKKGRMLLMLSRSPTGLLNHIT